MRNTVVKLTFIILAFNLTLAIKNVSVKTLCMRNTVAKLTFSIIEFNVTFTNKLYGDTKRRCVIQNQTQAQSKCPVALDQSILKSSCIKTTASASGLSYELRVNGEKKINGNWDISKNGHSTFHAVTLLP